MADTEATILSTPYDIWEYYLLDLDPKSLQAACRANKQFHSICKNKSFWRKKLHKDYPLLLDILDDDYNEDWIDRSDEDESDGENSNWQEISSKVYTDEEIDNYKDRQKYLRKENFTVENGDIDYERMWKFFTTFFMKYGKIVTITIPITLAIFKDKNEFRNEYEDELMGKPSGRRDTYHEYSHSHFLSDSSINLFNTLNSSNIGDISRILNEYNHMTGKNLNRNDICEYFKYALRKLSYDYRFYHDRIRSAEYERPPNSGLIEWIDDKYPQSVTNFVKTYGYIYDQDYHVMDGIVHYDNSFLLKPLKCKFNPDTSSIELKAHVILTSEIFEFSHFENMFMDEFKYADWVETSNTFFGKSEKGDILLDMALFNNGGYYDKSIDIHNRAFQKREQDKRNEPSSSSG